MHAYYEKNRSKLQKTMYGFLPLVGSELEHICKEPCEIAMQHIWSIYQCDMAYNELFALAFVAPYVASGKRIPPETIQEMMRRALYHVKWYFGMTDLNTEKGKAANKKVIVKYVKWYTSERERQYPTSFKVDFVGQPHENACYYRITRCPIFAYAKKLGVSELMPLFCELDSVMIALQHGVLHRQQTLASGGEFCDYYITGNQE